MFICPICKKKLLQEKSSYRCKNKHCFDLSKFGYVNLLTTVGHNPQKTGDNNDMVKARNEFLNKDYYMPLAHKLSEVLFEDVKSRKIANPIVIDSGCGEGYYTINFAKRLEKASVFGLDISKTAVTHAGKRMKASGLKNLSLAVASSFELPFDDKSADIIISIFAPVCNTEYSRVLKQKGHLFVVAPDEDHLLSLKEFLYDEPYKNKPNEYGLDNFTLLNQINLKFDIELLGNIDIMNLFSMTPYFYKTSKEAHQKLSTLENLTTLCDFSIYIYEKK